MAKARTGAGLVAGCLVLWAGMAPASANAAPPSVAQMLSIRPKQDGVNCTTPAAAEQDQCKVELLSGSRPGSSGWLLRDGHGLPLRRFFDTNGDRQIDVLSFYQDGVEVYREIDSKYSGKIDQYRWLNAGGMKWGINSQGDERHHIDTWKMISAEEAGQEALQAVINRDFARLQALWITEAEMKALEMSATEVSRIQGLQAKAAVKFQATATKLNLDGKTHFVRLEAGPPQCVPGDALGMKHDLVKQPKASVLYETGGTHQWLPLGEMIQVGLAWRLVESPAAGDEAADSGSKSDPEMQRMLDELKALDARAPRAQDVPGANAEIVRYNIERADLVTKILAKVKAEDREQWTRQLADCLSAAAQSSPENDKAAYQRLMQLEEQAAREQPGSPLAAYVTFREMSADYATKLAQPGPEFAKAQEKWLDRLAKFVQDYPQAEDTPDALLQLGMVSEFVGKEALAKKWYEKLSTDFPNHTLAAKAKGAQRRLEIEGKVLELSGPLASGGSFDIQQLRGKVVIVYYWASWNQQSVGDFARLKVLLGTYAGKVELVCVNLDNAPPQAGAAAVTPPGGVQIAQPGGLDSPLAVQYGVMVLPNLFLVDPSGKVVSRTVQIGTLEEEVKKLLK